MSPQPPQNPLRIIFAGTPDFAGLHLQSILDHSKHTVVAVYSQPDRPAGRGKKCKPSPVKQVALDHNIPVFQPLNFKADEDLQQLKALDADLMVVVAYGLLLPKPVLETPRLGCINVHASLLPRWRGAAPIQRAIQAGDRKTGVVIMQMDIGLDTGDMLLQADCDITETDNASSLHDKLAEIGTPALNKALDLISAGEISPIQQDHDLSCYADKLTKSEAEINWQESAVVIDRKIRAFNPFPTAFTQLNGERIKILQASLSSMSGEPGSILFSDKKSIVVGCGNNSLTIERMQLPGGKALDTNAIMASKAGLFTKGTSFDPDSHYEK